MADDDDHDIPETGAVFTFGKSKFADNLPGKFWIRNDRFLKVSCGDEHTALVAESGRLFTFGSNDWGQLGVGSAKASTKPTCVKSLKTHKIGHVACGRTHTIAATRDGKLFAFGANNEHQLGMGSAQLGEMSQTPVLVEGLDVGAFKMLSAGTEHSAALTDGGRLYVWGGGSEGQLGLGPDVTDVSEPRQLKLDSDVVSVSCGYYHTAVVTASGRLYMFGETDCGKLGYSPEEEDDHFSPRHISAIPGRVRAAACGGSHTLALTDEGKVYSFGDGSNGQLGHGNTTLRCTEPRLVQSLAKHRVVALQCGENHSAAVTERGALYAFGDGRHGKLALGQENFANQFRPVKVQRFRKFAVDELSCGGCHSLVLAKPRLENGELSSSESEDDLRISTNSLRRSQTLKTENGEDMELTLTPRERRQNKAANMTLGPGSPMLNRTLPALRPLNRVPPNNFAATIAGDHIIPDRATKQRSEMPVPTIRADDMPDSKKGSESESENDSPSSPAKKPPQKRTPFNRTRSEDEDLEAEKRKLSEGSDSEEDSEEEKKPSKPVPARRPVKGKPEPVPRPKKSKDSPEESEEEEVEEKKESEETEEDSEDQKNKRKGKTKKKEEKKKKGVFGKKKKTGAESEEDDEESEDEEDEEEEDSEEEDPKKKKKAKDEEKKKLKEEQKKQKEEEAKKKKEEAEARKKEKEAKKKGKKGKKDVDEEEEKESEEEGKKSVKGEEKVVEETIESDHKSPDASEPEVKSEEEKKEPEAPPPKKKSKLCTIL